MRRKQAASGVAKVESSAREVSACLAAGPHVVGVASTMRMMIHLRNDVLLDSQRDNNGRMHVGTVKAAAPQGPFSIWPQMAKSWTAWPRKIVAVASLLSFLLGIVKLSPNWLCE